MEEFEILKMEIPQIFHLTSQNNILDETIKKIMENQNQEKYIINLAPGRYSLQLNIPSFVTIKGSGIDSSYICLENKIELESDIVFTDLTILYSNYRLEENLELFVINCQNYKLKFKENNSKLNYTNVIKFCNLKIQLYDIIGGIMLDVLSGHLIMDRVEVNSKIIDSENILSLENNILVRLGYFCELSMISSKVYYETKLDNSFLCYSELGKINISNSEIILDSKMELKHNYLFYLIYSHLTVNYSNLENQVSEGKILFLDTNEDLINENTISNLRVHDNKLYIKSFLPDHLYNKIILFMKGIEYEGHRYIFGNRKESEEEIVIKLQLTGSLEDQEFKLEPKIKYLFSLDFNHTNFLENSRESFWQDNIFSNYVVNYNLVKLEYYDNLLTLICNEKNEVSFNNLDGSIQVNKLKCEKFPDLNLGQISKSGHGYALHDKERVGFQCFDMSGGKTTSSGKYAWVSGFDNSGEGDYSSTLGYQNISYGLNSLTSGTNLVNNFDNCLVVGKYNNKDYDINHKLLVVGNGNPEKRNDTFTVFKNGMVKVDDVLQAKTVTDGIITMEEGNITQIHNMEVEENLFVSGDLYAENEIKGCALNSISNVLNIGGNVITTLKIDLQNFISPSNYGGIISPESNNLGLLLTLDEKVNGLLYRMEVTCVSEPNRHDFRFLVSDVNAFKKGNVPEKMITYPDCLVLDLISSYEWEKGKRIVEVDKFKFDWDYSQKEYFLYLAREIERKGYTDKGEKKLEGKFLVRLFGSEVF